MPDGGVMEPARGVIIGEKYVLERVLGHGGMGSVWLAHHWKLGAPVAIKLLRTEHTRIQLAQARFEREAMMMAKLRSRHVIGVNDYGVQDNHAYIVMEMLVGEDLNQRLQRRAHLRPEEVQFIIEQAARGLVVAHAAGIIHRDLKPANIFIAEQDREEVVKLLDFGIAKAMEGPLMGGRLTGTRGESETKTGILLGSPHYMSPEHIQGDWDIVDQRSDLWALGVITFRALTGQLPFPGERLPSVMLGICREPPPSARSLVPDLPVALDDFFARALAKPREERFDDATQLAHALVEALDLGASSRRRPPDRPIPTASPLSATPDATAAPDPPSASDMAVTRPRDGVTVDLQDVPTLERPPPKPAPPIAPPREPRPQRPSALGAEAFVTEPTFIGEPTRNSSLTITAVMGTLAVLGLTGVALTFLAHDEPPPSTAQAFVGELSWLTQEPKRDEPVVPPPVVPPRAEASVEPRPPAPAKPAPIALPPPSPTKEAIPDFGY